MHADLLLHGSSVPAARHQLARKQHDACSPRHHITPNVINARMQDVFTLIHRDFTFLNSRDSHGSS
jgi:hypothetical protein